MDAKRGFVPEDERNFSPEALQIMRTASRHICYLINEGYDLQPASTFVGNHYMLSERQRLAIMRSVATEEQISVRKSKQVQIEELAGKEVWIDGFNIIITLEVILSDSIFFSCMDGTLRDLAALQGRTSLGKLQEVKRLQSICCFCLWRYLLWIIIRPLQFHKGVKMADKKGFDLWADEYDKSVAFSREEHTYPFAGYEEVLAEIRGKRHRCVDQRDSRGSRIDRDSGFYTGLRVCPPDSEEHGERGRVFRAGQLLFPV